jgi:hypothetical protein
MTMEAFPSLDELLLNPVVASAAAFLAAPCALGSVYDPACDVDHDSDVDILDFQPTAGHWNRSGVHG